MEVTRQQRPKKRAGSSLGGGSPGRRHTPTNDVAPIEPLLYCCAAFSASKDMDRRNHAPRSCKGGRSLRIGMPSDAPKMQHSVTRSLLSESGACKRRPQRRATLNHGSPTPCPLFGLPQSDRALMRCYSPGVQRAKEHRLRPSSKRGSPALHRLAAVLPQQG
eukprot:scaffold185882_cov28-Tisochrysis_lutea.AAC.2